MKAHTRDPVLRRMRAWILLSEGDIKSWGAYEHVPLLSPSCLEGATKSHGGYSVVPWYQLMTATQNERKANTSTFL